MSSTASGPPAAAACAVAASSVSAPQSRSVFDALGMTRKSPSGDPPDDDVVDDVRVVGIEQVRVLRAARLDAVEVVRERPLEQRVPRPAAHEHRSEVRHVEHDRALATGAVLLEHAGVLDRHVPAAELDHARAELTVLGVERAPSERGVGHADSACGPDRGAGDGRGGNRSSGSWLARAGDVDELRRRLEPVLHEEVQVVALVEHLDVDLGVQLTQPARLAVLLRHELLVQRRDLDVTGRTRGGRSRE